MRSLRSKFTIVGIVLTLVCISAIGSLSVLSIQRTAEQISTQYMNELCNDKANELNNYLDGVQQNINIAAHYLTDDLSIVELVNSGAVGAIGTGDSRENADWDSPAQRQFDRYLEGYIEDVELLMHSIAYNADNALNYFFRLNPELSQTQKGFLYLRHGNADFEEQPTTDVFAYSVEDKGHVGWYYQTLDRGRPSWLYPYVDDNLGLTVASYTAPIYKAGTFVGVVGMSIDYQQLVERIDDLGFFNTGYAFITDDFGKIIYHQSLSYGTITSEVNSQMRMAEADMRQHRGSTDLIDYTFEDVHKRAAWRTMSNGLRVFVAAPVSEIESTWRVLINRIIVISVLLLAVTGAVITFVVRRITKPLVRLTLASEQIAEGNYDVDLPYHGRDEVGTLTNSFRRLTEHLKVYVSDLNSRAYKDALTSVKNKAALDIFAGQIDALSSGEKKYGVLMLDCNELKAINDRFGHQKGDLYLQNACRVICRSFNHSPVFRVGGDEFVVILQNDAYQDRDCLISTYQDNVKLANQSVENPWDRVSLAMGYADYDAQRDGGFADVLRRADEAMYHDKKDQKHIAQ